MIMEKEITISNIGKLRASGFREFRALMAVESGFECGLVDEQKPNIVRSDDSLFAAIFTVNPLTKLPDGDLAIFMSEKTSPEVRMFIEQNLLRDVGEGESVQAADMSDDEIVRYSRKHGESVGDYRQRIYDTLLSDMRADIERSNK